MADLKLRNETEGHTNKAPHNSVVVVRLLAFDFVLFCFGFRVCMSFLARKLTILYLSILSTRTKGLMIDDTRVLVQKNELVLVLVVPIY